MKTDPLPKAINNLGVWRIFRHGGTEYRIACLLRDEDTRPLRAPWWKGKEVSIIAADLSGNFFLRHCDGTVRYWNHSTQTDLVVAASVREFVSSFEIDNE
jgi:hypothetical protein